MPARSHRPARASPCPWLPAEARRPARLALGVAACAAFVLGIGTRREQVRTWRNDRTLFEHALAVTRDNPYAEFNLGITLQLEGEQAAALRHLEAAARLDPKSGELRLVLERAREEAARMGAP